MALYWARTGSYAGQAVESTDGSHVFLLGPSGGYVGQWQKEPGGQWMRLGPSGSYQGRAQQGPPASQQ